MLGEEDYKEPKGGGVGTRLWRGEISQRCRSGRWSKTRCLERNSKRRYLRRDKEKNAAVVT